MSENVRQFPAEPMRVESGPIQFGDDWPGVFFRGVSTQPEFVPDLNPVQARDQPLDRDAVPPTSKINPKTISKKTCNYVLTPEIAIGKISTY